MHIGCILVLLLAWSIEARLRRYEDSLCQLTGAPARDAHEAHVFEEMRTQRCWLFAGPNTKRPGVMVYDLVGNPIDSPKKFVWRLDRSNIEIDESHLDMGKPPNEVSYGYIHLLDDSESVTKSKIALSGKPADHSKSDSVAITGMVLGEKLGGSGLDSQNLFPQSQKTQAAYKALEDKIYRCIKSGEAHKANIEWKFNYQTSTRTRPYSVWYHVRFIGLNHAASNCADIELHLDN